MIRLSSIIKFYSKKTVTDIGTRSGPCTPNNFSYGYGMESVVQKYWKGASEDKLEFDIGMFLEQCADFDADRVKPCLTEDEYTISAVESSIVTSEYRPAIHDIDFGDYYRRLEDIAPQYIERYLGNLVYSILHNNDGIASYVKTHGTQATLSDPEEEGEYVELADLLTMDNLNDWSLAEKQEASLKLPYVLKRLHNLSMYCGIHMIEFIVAYLKARDDNKHSRSLGSTKSLKVNAVILNGIHKYSKYGRVGEQITVESRNKKAARMFDWIEGNLPEYQSYSEDYVNFVHYMDVLNICRDDDFTKYDGLFMDELIVTVVTPNSQYDMQVFNALQVNASTPAKPSIEDPMENTIELFNQAIDVNDILVERVQKLQSYMYEKIHEQGVTIYTMYKLFTDNEYISKGLHWEYGYLYHNDKPAVIKTSWVNSDSLFTESDAIISEIGYIVQVTRQPTILCLDIDYANAYVVARCRKVSFDERRMDWLRVTP